MEKEMERKMDRLGTTSDASEDLDSYRDTAAMEEEFKRKGAELEEIVKQQLTSTLEESLNRLQKRIASGEIILSSQSEVMNRSCGPKKKNLKNVYIQPVTAASSRTDDEILADLESTGSPAVGGTSNTRKANKKSKKKNRSAKEKVSAKGKPETSFTSGESFDDDDAEKSVEYGKGKLGTCGEKSETSFTSGGTCGDVVKGGDARTCGEPEELEAPDVHAELVEKLESMGFSKEMSIRGLEFSGNSSVEEASNWIVEHDDTYQMPSEPDDDNHAWGFEDGVWEAIDAEDSQAYRNKELTPGETGRIGEWLAFEHYRSKFSNKRVTWMNQYKESGGPYDILVEDDRHNVEYYIEVKSTAISASSFTVSPNESLHAMDNRGTFLIARVDLNDSKIATYTNPLASKALKIKLYTC